MLYGWYELSRRVTRRASESWGRELPVIYDGDKFVVYYGCSLRSAISGSRSTAVLVLLAAASASVMMMMMTTLCWWRLGGGREDDWIAALWFMTSAQHHLTVAVAVHLSRIICERELQTSHSVEISLCRLVPVLRRRRP